MSVLRSQCTKIELSPMKSSCRLANRLKCGENHSPNVLYKSPWVLVAATINQEKGMRKYIAHKTRNVMAPRLLALTPLGPRRLWACSVVASSRAVGDATEANGSLMGL